MQVSPKTIILSNKFICIDGKPVFFKTLTEKGILRIGDLISENNELITKRKARELNLTPLDLFRLVSVVNALPSEWRDLLKRSSHSDKRTFNLQDQIVLSLNGQKTPINQAVSKTIYKELRNRVISTPCAQKKYNSCFVNDALDRSAKYIAYHIVSPPIQSCVNFNSNY